jgi:hypothetical protein
MVTTADDGEIVFLCSHGCFSDRVTHSDPATLLEMSLTIMRMLDGNGVWVLVLVTGQWFLQLSPSGTVRPPYSA